MVLERLLGAEMSPAEFLERHYLKFPYVSSGGAQAFVALGAWPVAEIILAQPDPDVLVARGGELWEEKRLPTVAEAKALYAAGYTIVLRDSEKHHPKLGELAAAFERDFQAPIDIQLYFTPAEQFGFGWHYDAEDVFILQAQGSKDYVLRKNTVNPWPLKETLPRDMKVEREIMPYMKCTLATGDWLYIPAGYWHKADARAESISLAVGVLSTAALDVFDFLRPRLLGSFRWRQRLPTPGAISPATTAALFEAYRVLFAELGADLQQQLASEAFVREFLAAKGRPSA